MADKTFEINAGSPFRLDLTVWTLRRRAHNIVDRWDGTTYRRVLALRSGPVEVAVAQLHASELGQLRVTVAGQRVDPAARAAVTTTLQRLLGANIDMTEFNQFAQRHRRLIPLVNRFRGMRPPRFATVFEGVINAIACQQVSLTLGIHLLNRLSTTYGVAMHGTAEAIHAFPSPIDLAGLIPEDLRLLGFSHQKGRTIIELARSVVEGKLDLESFADLSDEEAAARLLELRGLGRWSAEYVLLRGLGRTHVFPGDDVGARKNLQHWLKLAKPLDYAGVRRVLSPWRRYAGLIYFHLLLDRLAEAGHIRRLRPELP